MTYLNRPMRLAAALSIMVPLGGCTSKSASETSGGPPDLDSIDTGREFSGCPTFTGIRSTTASPSWSYREHGYPFRSHYLSRSVVSLDASSGAVLLTETETQIFDHGDWTNESTISFECDALGLSLESYRFETKYTGPGLEDAFEGPSGNVVLDTPALIVPASMTPGDVWTIDRVGTLTRTTGEVSATYGGGESTAEVIGVEDVEAEGGILPAMRVDETTDGLTVSLWYHEEYGLIKVGGLTLYSYEEGEPDEDGD